MHPAAAEIVAKGHFEHGIRVVDTFVSPSRPLAVLTGAGVSTPRSLGLQPATRDYLDTSRWEILVPERSIMTVAEGLLAGRYDSGVTALSIAESHPGQFRVEQELGSVDDPWMVYGRRRVTEDGLVLWPGSPVSRFFR